MAREIIEHHKTISIPICLSPPEPLFLTVRDRRFKDWIFVAGGCRKREISNPLRCALRELDEETRGVFNLKLGEYTHFTFTTRNRTEAEQKMDDSNNIDVIYIYHVYIFFMNLDENERNKSMKKFTEERIKADQLKQLNIPIRRTHDENDRMMWDTLDNFKTKKQWETIKTHVLDNPEFYTAINSSNKIKFNTRVS
jgi:8-oxo-dGTP pyrophosphatase MutT (NUDIX family)